MYQKYPKGIPLERNFNPEILNSAYKECGELTKEYGRTFYFGTIFMTKEKAQRVWAIYQWCRRTDEIVDGPNSNVMLTNEMYKVNNARSNIALFLLFVSNMLPKGKNKLSTVTAVFFTFNFLLLL